MPGYRGGFALVEVLVALLVFSIAIAGGLRAQLGAMTATRDTLSQLRAVRLLEDLVHRSDVGSLAMLAPAALPVAGSAGGPDLPDALADWAGQRGATLADARLCILRRGALLEVSLAWRSSRTITPVTCSGDAPQVLAHVVAP
jgi:prepilin-type N-terminal cleavage/methylation domain-containing protein